MTEAEWLASNDPAAMLRLATGRRCATCGCLWCDNGDGTVSMARGQKCCRECDVATFDGTGPRIVSDRKLRLFACACCRAYCLDVWSPAIGGAVEAAEEYADDPTKGRERGSAFEAAGRDLGWGTHPDSPARLRARLARDTLVVNELWPSQWVLTLSQSLGTQDSGSDVPAHFARLLREIVGNPFRPMNWWRWQEGLTIYVSREAGEAWPKRPLFTLTRTVLAIAQAIYDEREWNECPVLADAMEDAGCDSEVLLRHLRGQGPCDDETHQKAGGNYWCPKCGGTEEGSEGWMKLRGPHARGCWVIDLVLGKS